MAGYYNDQDLQRLPDIGKETPELMHRFFEYYNDALKENNLSGREKALIGLAVSHVLQCPYCIDTFTRRCQEAGLSRAEMMESVHVGAAVAAGSAVSHSLQMLNILERDDEDDRESAGGSTPLTVEALVG